MTALLLSCEHGGNEVPARLKASFNGHEDILDTHRGWDPGALDLFHELKPLAAHSTFTTLSRLCIEMNRTEGHPQHYSRFTRDLPEEQRAALLRQYRAYRQAFTDQITAQIKAGREVLHIAVHSFTPVLDGQRRTMDIGLLYDPAREVERSFCWAWRRAINRVAPGLVVRMNQPYKGTADGFPTALRRQFPKGYAGIELEVNQRFVTGGRMDPAVKTALFRSLSGLITAR